VRAAVPGTPQAQEAVIENSVPQVAAVKRSAATLEITYDGSPQFRPIEGTPLQYAVNAPIPVIEVDPSAYYALDNGVWFVSNSAFGAWSAATWVPPVIYSIPRSSPLHYVTYVRVYEATPEVVYEGYYPGYVGSYVAPGATVVYGTGWYYQPWIGTVWYGAPVTWGFGFSFYSSWWGPWPYTPWFWAGWAPYPFFRPWWGPWCAPVAIAPAFVPHRVFVGNGVAPVGVGRVTVNNIHANTVNVTNIFNRWGNRVATPLGPRATFASGNGMRPTRAGAMQATRGGAAMASRGPGNESMAFAGGGAPHSSVTGAGGAGGNPNVQGFRRSGGQWQSFAGNGQWRNVNAPNLNSQSPPIGQSGGTRPGAIGGAPFGSGAPGGGPRPGTIGGAPVVSGAPTHGWSGPSAGQPTSPSGSQFATGTQNNRWSGSPATRSMAPQFGAGAQNNRWSGGPPTVRSLGPSGSGRSFGAPAGVHFGQGGGVEVAPMGRSGGAWAPAHGGAAANMAGGNAAGGRPAIGGGGGHGWGGAGGGGRMGGSMR